MENIADLRPSIRQRRSQLTVERHLLELLLAPDDGEGLAARKRVYVLRPADDLDLDG